MKMTYDLNGVGEMTVTEIKALRAMCKTQEWRVFFKFLTMWLDRLGENVLQLQATQEEWLASKGQASMLRDIITLEAILDSKVEEIEEDEKKELDSRPKKV